MQNSPLVSVIITTFGKCVKLERAINSCLNQDYENVEVIVVDDNEPSSVNRKETEKIMQRFNDDRIVYLKHSANLNGSVARNTGIKKARGEYIAFLDNDDFYFHNRIRMAVSKLSQLDDNFGGICFATLIMYRNQIRSIYKKEQGHIYNLDEIITEKDIGSGSNLFMRATAIELVNGFDERFHRNQDIEFFLRVIKRKKVIFEDVVTIVKDNGSGKVLNYKNTKVSYEYFDEMFSNDIKNINDSSGYHINRKKSLLSIAISTGSAANIKDAIFEIKKITNLEFKEQIISCFSPIIAFLVRILNCLKYDLFAALVDKIIVIKNRNNEKKLMDSLSIDILDELKNQINE